MSRWAWLWPANAVATFVTAAAAILQPIAVEAAPCDGPVCDPHGYIAIFTTVPAVGVVVLAVIALVLLIVRQRAGFGAALGAAACCGGLVLFVGAGLGRIQWLVVGAVVMVVVLAAVGVRLAPPPRRARLEEPPYPSVG